MSTFLVEAGMPGYSVGQKIYDKTGMRASNTAELVFDDCIVPAENLVGGVGESLLHMMGNLEIERLALAAMSLGIGRRALAEMNQYATDRTAFGSSIRDFGQIQRHIGESWAKYRAMRAYIYDTASNLVLGQAGQRRGEHVLEDAIVHERAEGGAPDVRVVAHGRGDAAPYPFLADLLI